MKFPHLKHEPCNIIPGHRKRIYFTCHSQDFDDTFKQICADLFAAMDHCVVFYKEDMSADASDEDLQMMHLFVIPVTHRLLTEPNPVMDKELAFALKEHIPVIPVMMGDGLDKLYRREDKFGKLQYLDPIHPDPTAIPYEDKLKTLLESIFEGEMLREEIRNALSPRIFLSYRKKDRKYANELMQRLQILPSCRYAGIWFDEMLVAGRAFDADIQNELMQCDLVALLVTPNLLERPGGEPNYVMGVEYKAAKNAGKRILPIEAVPTDGEQLREKFPGISNCIDLYDADGFEIQTSSALEGSMTEYRGTPEKREYLVGLAYLEGICVVKNPERGVAMITAAAEKMCPEAMKKLQTMYFYGLGVPQDNQKALMWAKQLVDHCYEHCDILNPKVIAAVRELGVCYDLCGDHKSALKMFEEAFLYSRMSLDSLDPEAIVSMSNLGLEHLKQGNLDRALQLLQKARKLMAGSPQHFGLNSRATLNVARELAMVYLELSRRDGDPKKLEKAFEINFETLVNQKLFLGREDPDTLLTQNNMVVIYADLKDYEMALKTCRELYDIYRKTNGEAHPDTLKVIDMAVDVYNLSGDLDDMTCFVSEILRNQRESLGNGHPVTQCTMEMLAKISDRVYHIRKQSLGEGHRKTLESLNLAIENYNLSRNHSKALNLVKEFYSGKEEIPEDSFMQYVWLSTNAAITFLFMGMNENAVHLCFWVAGLHMELPKDMVEHIAFVFEKCGYIQQSRQMLAHLEDPAPF